MKWKAMIGIGRMMKISQIMERMILLSLNFSEKTKLSKKAKL